MDVQDLTEEQKVAMIRKELPLCSAEEAHNALEACSLDVNFAIASLSQVLPRPVILLLLRFH